MKRLLSLLLLAVSLFAAAQPAAKSLQTLTASTQLPAGVSAARLARIDGLLQEYVAKGWIPGATALVTRNGRIIYHKSFGYSDFESKKPLTNDAIFRIASQTKAITSVGIMMLFEEGRLLLDDPVSKYIPEFKNPKVLDSYNAADTTYTTVPAKSEITIRHLLAHTSGLGYAQIGNKQMTAIYAKAGVVGGIGVGNLVLGDKIKVLGGLPLFHQPGEKYTYGLNTDVLGYVIEVVSGLTLDQFFQQRISTPLGMKDTYFFLPPGKQQRLVALHTFSKDKLQKAPPELNMNGVFYADYPNRAGTYYSGGGGLSSTALDYTLFMQTLLNGGSYNGVRLLSPASVRMMTANQLGELPFSKGHRFGLGFELVTEQSKGMTPLSPGSFSWGGMFSSTYWIDPREKITAQLFINTYPSPHGEVHEKFKALVYAAME